MSTKVVVCTSSTTSCLLYSAKSMLFWLSVSSKQFLVKKLGHKLLLILFAESFSASVSCLSGNHSCEPNAEVTFPYNNATLVLVALKDIAENEACIYS